MCIFSTYKDVHNISILAQLSTQDWAVKYYSEILQHSDQYYSRWNAYI